MKIIYCSVVVLFIVHLCSVSTALDGPGGTPSTDSEPDNVTVNNKYCFRMSWLGPKFNNGSIFKNATCEEILHGAKDTPCRLPLIVSYDGSEPNTTWIWEHYGSTPTHVGCLLVPGEVCAKFTYRFNGAVENITYMCTKVYVEDEGAITSGCQSHTDKLGRETQVCICETLGKGQMPCNGATSQRALRFGSLLAATMFLCLRPFIFYNQRTLKV